LRFVAAFAVLLYHVEIFKHLAEMPNWSDNPFWNAMGPYGVVCFFCLSGFLITYLLLEETERTGTILVRKFYMRRILRIWPLYYLIVALGFVLLPLTDALLTGPQWVLPGHTPLKITLFLLLVPNLVWVTFGPMPLVSPLWSVGVEEQFYLLWPALMRVLRGRVLIGILGVIVVMLCVRYAIPWSDDEPRSVHSIVARFLWTLKLECMATGALAAYWLHENVRPALSILYHPLMQLAALLLIGVSLWQGRNYGELDNLVWGSAFAVVILNLSSNPRSLLRLENPVLDYLGRISFGIYVYHSFAIIGVLLVLRNLVRTEGVLFNCLVYGLSIALTILLATISYRYYESPFLRLKRRLMVVESSAR